MRRVCNGLDVNLLMFVDVDGKRIDKVYRHETGTSKPCDCGRVFDDERRSTVFPHMPI